MSRLFDYLVAGNVLAARQLHALLLDEAFQQPVHQVHQLLVAVQLEVLLLNLGHGS
jgi:hypothetical protein